MTRTKSGNENYRLPCEMMLSGADAFARFVAEDKRNRWQILVVMVQMQPTHVSDADLISDHAMRSMRLGKACVGNSAEQSCHCIFVVESVLLREFVSFLFVNGLSQRRIWNLESAVRESAAASASIENWTSFKLAETNAVTISNLYCQSSLLIIGRRYLRCCHSLFMGCVMSMDGPCTGPVPLRSSSRLGWKKFLFCLCVAVTKGTFFVLTLCLSSVLPRIKIWKILPQDLKTIFDYFSYYMSTLWWGVDSFSVCTPKNSKPPHFRWNEWSLTVLFDRLLDFVAPIFTAHFAHSDIGSPSSSYFLK